MLTIQWHAGTLLHYGQIDLQRIGQRGDMTHDRVRSATAVVRSTDGLTCPLGTEPVFVLFNRPMSRIAATMDAGCTSCCNGCRLSPEKDWAGAVHAGPPTAEVSR